MKYNICIRRSCIYMFIITPVTLTFNMCVGVHVIHRHAPALTTTSSSHSTISPRFSWMSVSIFVSHLYKFASDARSCICWTPVPEDVCTGRNFVVTCTVHAMFTSYLTFSVSNAIHYLCIYFSIYNCLQHCSIMLYIH